MKLFKKRRYYFSDSSIASDTIIAFIMGTIALIIEIAGIATSIATRGSAPRIFGMLFIIAIILSVSGTIFAWIGYHAQEGGMKGKRFSIAINVISLAILLFVIIL